MTPSTEVAIRPRMGRKKLCHEPLAVKFAAGTRERIAAVLEEKEDRTDFIWEAVERELKRREAGQKRKPGRHR
jgi:hypothetical protein